MPDKMFTDKEIAVVKAIQQVFPLVAEPYKEVGRQVGLSEQEVLTILTDLRKRGCLKKIAVALRQNTLGYKVNVMLVWNVPEQAVEQLGAILAADSHVSHCYERERACDFPYNLYAMTHFKTEQEYTAFLQKIKKQFPEYALAVLRTQQELKKAGMQYFS